MGLEVTVLVVLLSRCSYMTVDRAGERGGESDRRRGAVRGKKVREMERRQEKAEVTGR